MSMVGLVIGLGKINGLANHRAVLTGADIIIGFFVLSL